MSKPLTREQRYVISTLLKRNESPARIAEEIGCHVSTVYRELRRNACKDGHYSPALAHEKALERRERIVTNSALKPGVLERALKLLRDEQWSPRQISGKLALDGIRISHERIYQEIRADKTGELASHTRHGMKHRKRGVAGKGGVKNIPNRVSIHDRPPEADGKRFGDWELDLSKNPQLEFARNMFMMSFYLRGMSFIDMAFLRKSDLKSGYITYRRRKTGQRLIIKWTAEMQAILAKYPENKSDYLLPIIKAPDTNERSVYRNVSYSINQRLKTIAEILSINMPLTMYVARHSWVSAAKAKGIPVSVISEGMGHDSESTTQIYLASLDASVVDSANSIILDALK